MEPDPAARRARSDAVGAPKDRRRDDRRRQLGGLLVLAAAWQLPFLLTHADIVRYRLPILPIAMLLPGLLVGHAMSELLERRRTQVLTSPAR